MADLLFSQDFSAGEEHHTVLKVESPLRLGGVVTEPIEDPDASVVQLSARMRNERRCSDHLVVLFGWNQLDLNSCGPDW